MNRMVGGTASRRARMRNRSTEHERASFHCMIVRRDAAPPVETKGKFYKLNC